MSEQRSGQAPNRAPGPEGIWRFRSRAWAVTGIYATVAVLWIYFSDQALMALVQDPQEFTRWSVFKGIAFVSITSVLLLLLIWKAFGALEQAYGALKHSQQALSASQAQLSAVIQSAMDAIITCDDKGKVRLFNGAAERMFGLDAKLALGQPLTSLLPGGINWKSDHYHMTSGLRANGEHFPIEAAVSRVQQSRGGFFTAILRDVSLQQAQQRERLQAEERLRQLNESLEHKVAERTRELKATATRAEAADRLKSAFLATMSHELRTPLNCIIGFTGTILQGLAGPVTAEQTKQLGMVSTSARHLLELINDVLDLSRIEAGQLQLKPGSFALHASLKHLVASVSPLAEAKGLGLDIHVAQDLEHMHSDRRRVEQIVLNLLQNAIKFTESGGVTLRAEYQPADPADQEAGPQADPETAAVALPALRLRIIDTGKGIKAHDLERLFQPFSQLDSGLTRQHEGTGLGLAICLRLATLLGGTIHASSTWQQGSEFSVLLPLDLPAQSLIQPVLATDSVLQRE